MWKIFMAEENVSAALALQNYFEVYRKGEPVSYA